MVAAWFRSEISVVRYILCHKKILLHNVLSNVFISVIYMEIGRNCAGILSQPIHKVFSWIFYFSQRMKLNKSSEDWQGRIQNCEWWRIKEKKMPEKQKFQKQWRVLGVKTKQPLIWFHIYVRQCVDFGHRMLLHYYHWRKLKECSYVTKFSTPQKFSSILFIGE